VTFRPRDSEVLPFRAINTVSTRRVAEMLDVTSKTICAMIEDGTLKAYKVREKANSPWRISYDSVLEYLGKVHEKNALEKRF
jgi:excisionase family DNA binding protein